MQNYPQMSRLHGRRSGFTLIELLVVVSIIALLISILLPSLKRAREQAKAAICMANLKGIATSSITYASDDSAENAVPVHPQSVDADLMIDGDALMVPRMAYGGKSGRGPYQNNPAYWGTGNGRGPGTRPLNRFLYKGGLRDYDPSKPQPGVDDLAAKIKADTKLDLDNFKCPSDDGPTGSHEPWFQGGNLSSYNYFGTSYFTNVLWITRGPGSKLETLSPFMRPLSRVPNPANTVYYSELPARRAIRSRDGQPDNSDCGYGEDDMDRVEGWHKRDWIFQTAFVDAHAEVTRIQGHRTPQLAEYPGYTFEQWQCVIFRGNNWQFDVLPSPPMATRIVTP